MQQDITSDVDPDLDPVRSAYICSVDPDPHSELDSDQRFKMKEKADQPTIFFRRKLYFSSLNQKKYFFMTLIRWFVINLVILLTWIQP